MKLPFLRQPSEHGLFFRGDDRDPEAIFASGLKPRGGARLTKGPRYRQQYGPQAAPDVVPNSTVSVTRDFGAATLFPPLGQTPRIWVYVLDLSTRDVVNVQAAQYRHVADQGGLATPLNLWPMYAQERAVNTVPAHAIVGAVAVERQLVLNDPQHTEFSPRKYVVNNRYSRSPDIRRQVFKQFHALILAHQGQWIRSPTRGSGIVANTRA